jgi:hypothetical protein
MKTEFIPYEQALELKELGFDEPCFGRYDGRDENKGKIWYEMPNLGKGWIPVKDVLSPLYQQAFRWFREKSFICHVTNDLSDSCYDEIYVYVMTKGYGDLIDRSEEYRTYEEAELACLKKLIEIAKNK